MACSLINSIPLDCRDSIGGIKEVKWKILPSLTTLAANYTLSSGVVTIASGSQTGWATLSQEKEVASFTDTITGNAQNGTNFSSQEVKVIFNKITSTLRNNLVLGAVQNRLHVAIRDMNDNYWLLGYERGMDIETAAGGSGTASGDRNGYEVTLKGMENVLYHLVNMSSATYTTLVFA